MNQAAARADALNVQWEELTAADFPRAVEEARGVCVLPIGVIEKHGPHLPLGTDVMAAREASIRAARREYAVVFPSYYFGQIWEARHQPGCLTLPPELLTSLLQAVCDEIHRNGFSKIVIVNGHGGNTHWLSYFCQAQLASRRDYAVFLARRPMEPGLAAKIKAQRKTDWGGHADEEETSRILEIRPDLVKMEVVDTESGLAQGRLQGVAGSTFTGIFWYADYPNHYAGVATEATPELGSLTVEAEVQGLAKVFRAVKDDAVTARLQNEFYSRSEKPLG
jgi:creatinine amidohydrolase